MPDRYSRQVLFGGLGAEGQQAIMRARVAIVGCGGLGSVQASLLVRAGVGAVRLIDRDFVEESNLQRQLLYDEDDARTLEPKAVVAARKLRAVNSLVDIEGLVDNLNPATIDRLLGGVDIILDATDNFDARYLLNDYAVKTGTPWIYGACVSSYGLTFTILPGETACLRCIFESAPPPGLTPTCDTTGVLGSIVALVAAHQAVEALKLAAGRRAALSRKIVMDDLWENTHDELDLPGADPHCPCCGERRFDYLEGREGSETSSLCGRDAVQIRGRAGVSLDLDELAERLSPLGRVERNRFLLRADIDAWHLTVFGDGRAIVGGTDDPGGAKSVYARYVGS
ncbi:MAG: ThiF family adenylyltransferase [Thermoleophilia bacterium]